MPRVRLLDKAREEMFIYPEVEMVDDYGNIVVVPAKEPVRIMATIQADQSSVAELAGQITVEVLKCTTREAPVGTWGRVKYNDRFYDVAIPPRRSPGATSASRHVNFSIRSRPGLEVD